MNTDVLRRLFRSLNNSSVIVYSSHSKGRPILQAALNAYTIVYPRNLGQILVILSIEQLGIPGMQRIKSKVC